METSLAEQMASRIANLVHPEKIVYLPRDDNWLGGEDLMVVVLARLGRGRTRHRYSTLIRMDLADAEVYPRRGMDLLIRTTTDIEKDRKDGDLFLRTLNEKGTVLYERPIAAES